MVYEGTVPELYCSDFNRSFTFYTKTLGFRDAYQRPEDKFAYLEREGSRIMIEQIGTSRNWITAELTYPFGRGINLEMGVRDAQKFYTSLQQAGCKFYLPLEDKWYRKNTDYVGNRQFIIQDPDGYLLRFAEDLGTKSAQEIERKEGTS